MQPAKQQQQIWKININAKFNNSYFKFKATNTNSSKKFLKFSLLLKLQEFIIKMNKRKPKTSILKKQTPSLKSKCIKFFHKFKTSPAKNKAIAAQKFPVLENPESEILSSSPKRSKIEEPILIGFLFIGTLALLTKAISENDLKGVIFHGLLILLYIYFKKYATIKDRTLMMFLTIALLVFAVMFPYGTKDYYVSQSVWNLWNYVTSSGSLYVLFQCPNLSQEPCPSQAVQPSQTSDIISRCSG